MTALDGTPTGVLLVHGAWHTKHCWDGVAQRLRALDIPVALAELHRGSLAGDTAAATEAMAQLPGPVIACGHSYGGAVITGLAPDRIAHLVYLAAIMPDTSETTLDLVAAHPTDLLASTVGDPSATTIDPAKAGDLFYAQLDEQQRAAHVATLVPQNMAPGFDRPTSLAWRSRPSTYVVCSEDRAIHPQLQRLLSQRATHAITWASDHAPFLSHEDDTVALLGKLAS
ncbi:MAG TPA: alpha/beta hydrolase [Mycobacteriales bacterium]|nr:alpha/beta hydrolase [Mycobacteriales bacterium]